MITSLALLGIVLGLWLLIALPLAVLIGRSIRVGQAWRARPAAVRGRDRPRRRTVAA